MKICTNNKMLGYALELSDHKLNGEDVDSFEKRLQNVGGLGKIHTKEKVFENSKSGVVLAVTLLVVLVVSIIAGSFLSFAMSTTHSFKHWRETDYAFLTAQTALEKTKNDVYNKFNEYYVAAPLSRSRRKFDWFGDSTEEPAVQLGQSQSTDYSYTAMNNESILYGTATVLFEGVNQISDSKRGPCDVKMTVTAYVGDSEYTLTEIVRYEISKSAVFNYAYFVNNYGWLYGNTITANGDVRANGNFSFKYNPYINGNAYASENPDLGTAGSINGSYNSYSIDDYLSNTDWTRARPGSPTSLPDDPDDPIVNYWEMGYDGSSEANSEQEVVEMPYLGDLEDYKYLATQESGSLVYPVTALSDERYILSTESTASVSGVYDGVGPDGVGGTADDGCLILVGTYDNPIEIDGPIVVEGDLIIKGYFTGQGTIYVGRNTHIVGDLIAKDPPVWDKPDEDPTATATINSDKDLLALASKGNTVLGDYTGDSSGNGGTCGGNCNQWQHRYQWGHTYRYGNEDAGGDDDNGNGNGGNGNGGNGHGGNGNGGNGNGGSSSSSSAWLDMVKQYMVPNGSFCQPYETDATDAVNGYDSDQNPNNGYKFNGDYTQLDAGSYVYDEITGETKDRKYYESSICPERVASYADSDLITQVDAVLYNNHLLVGNIGSTTFNGAIISRNEAIMFTGSICMNWDIRLGDKSEDAVDIDIYLPGTLETPVTRCWYQK